MSVSVFCVSESLTPADDLVYLFRHIFSFAASLSHRLSLIPGSQTAAVAAAAAAAADDDEVILYQRCLSHDADSLYA